MDIDSIQMPPVNKEFCMNITADINSVKDAKYGDIWYDSSTRKTYVYDEEFVLVHSDGEPTKERIKVERTNCCNCGAPLRGPEDNRANGVTCNYCGTYQYRWTYEYK